MATSYGVAVRNARLQSDETVIGVSPKLRFYSGSVPANAGASIAAAVLLVEMNLPSDWLTAPSAGSSALVGSWTGTAVATGSPTFYRVWDTAGTTCGIQGSSGVGTGDFPVNGTITTGQAVSVSSFTRTEGNP